MADAVLFHQRSSQEIRTADLLSRVVWSAHLLSDYAENFDTIQSSSHDHAEVSALLGIDSAAIAGACNYSRTQLSKTAALLGVNPPRKDRRIPGAFISKLLSLPKREELESAHNQLDGLIKNMAVMQPLQQSLTALSGEAELFRALRESARIMFGLKRPVFLLPDPIRPMLSGTTVEGESPLLTQLEIALESGQSLAARAFNENRPCSSFVDERHSTVPLVDIQLSRALRSEGLLCIPMNSGKRLLGVMVFGLSREQFDRKGRDLERMTSFANMAAKNFAAFRALREREQAIEAELARKFEQKARNVIHETVNPLSIINNYLKIVAEKLSEAPEVQQEFSILKDEIARVDRIIRRLSDMKERAPAVETIDINAVIVGMLALYGESFFDSNAIAIEKQLFPELPLARADRDSFKQILFNLWKNSAEAMTAGGSIRISTRLNANANGSSGIEIQLIDTGPGIPADVMERLFKPLDPERRPANSGVGLSIVASLVEKLCGEIKCESTPGKGTHFTIRLPHA